jgi:hypothetical protein
MFIYIFFDNLHFIVQKVKYRIWATETFKKNYIAALLAVDSLQDKNY